MKNKLLSGGGIVTALLASLCCITPVMAVLGGLGGIATTFSFLEPLRPYLIGLTVIVLWYAFYKAYSKNPAKRICVNLRDKKKLLFVQKIFDFCRNERQKGIFDENKQQKIKERQINNRREIKKDFSK